MCGSGCSPIPRRTSECDLYVEGRDRFDDFRVHQVSPEEFQRELPHYGEIVGLPTDGTSFVRALRDKLSAALDEVDANVPANEGMERGGQGLVIHKPGEVTDPPNKILVGVDAADQHPGRADRDEAMAESA